MRIKIEDIKAEDIIVKKDIKAEDIKVKNIKDKDTDIEDPWQKLKNQTVDKLQEEEWNKPNDPYINDSVLIQAMLKAMQERYEIEKPWYQKLFDWFKNPIIFGKRIIW